jgi:hypothetical protein
VNKREWRKRARMLGGQVEELKETVGDLRGLVRFHREQKYPLKRHVRSLLAWQRKVREAWDFSTWVHANSTVLALAILSEPKEEP